MINFEGRQQMGVGKELFGHACANGGVVLRPGAAIKVQCGHSKDHGAYCGGFCPHVDPRAAEGEPCYSAWAPEDIGVYLRRQTKSYRTDPGWGYYNEFLVDGNVWDEHLPWSIDAFITSKNDGGTLILL